MKRVLTVLTIAVLALLGSQVASAETSKPDLVGKNHDVSTRALGGPFTWVNQQSRACLDQDYTDGVPHTRVLAWACSGGPNQLWYTDSVGDGSIRLINRASGDCLDQDYTDGVAHSAVLAWPCSGGANQRWWPVHYTDGTFTLQNARSGVYLDQDYTGGAPHTGVQAWPFLGGLNQHWI